ncbi:MAG: glycoside hydrolase family 127 protein [Oscillospiraceae bacterium]|nr:glycoside hydrolase family 127 protein [Oscillospiraceae bacterium]
MMLKSECVSCDLLGEKYSDLAERLRTILDRYNGTPVGLFTGDECLSGLSPAQGTELCAVVEQMYSYELLYAYTGDAKGAERLEVLAFNALPATLSDDMWAHQYVQQSNQISCERFPGKSFFRTNGPEAHLFGLEPNYGCCTANFNQGWPKLALSAFLHRDNEILSAVPIPSCLNTETASVSLETNYPFENKLLYRIDTQKDCMLCVRIPSFAKNLSVNGQPMENNGMLQVSLSAGEQREISISFDTQPKFMDRPHGLKSVKCGSLVFSLPIRYEKRMLEYTKNNVERKFPYCDYEYVGKSDWNYGYSGSDLELLRRPLTEIPFSSEQPPVLLKTRVRKVEWELADGYESVCAKTPVSSKAIGPEEDILLYPYGCAKLRMTELPLCE